MKLTNKTNLRYIVDNITDNCQFAGNVNKDKRLVRTHAYTSDINSRENNKSLNN